MATRIERLRSTPYVAQLLLLALAHYGTARLSLTFGQLDGIVAPVWLPSGVALAGLLVFGRRAWPAIAASATLVDLGAGLPLLTVAGMATATTVEAVMAVTLLERARFRIALDGLRHVVVLVVLGAGVACGLAALLGAASLVSGGVASGTVWETWRVWWLGDVLGLMVVAPCLLVAVSEPTPHSAGAVEAAVVALAVVVVAFEVFGPSGPPGYLLFPLIAWTAARFGTRGVAAALVAVSVIGVLHTADGAGFFVRPDPIESLYLLDGYLAVLSLSGLALAAVVVERDRAHEELRRSNLHLAIRVAQRTKALQDQSEALARDRERLAEAQRIARVGSFEWDVKADVVRGSDELYRLFGFQPGTVFPRFAEHLDVIPPDDRERVRDAVRAAMATGDDFTLEHRVIGADGVERWVRSNGRVETEDGVPVRVAGTAQDVTASRQAEERFRNLLDAAPDAMVIVGSDGLLELVNRQTEALLGYAREELVGQPVEILLPERFHEAHTTHRAGFFGTPRTRPMGEGSELYARRKDGSEVPVEISLSPLRTERGTVVSAAIRDVTSRKVAEEELAHQALHDSLTGLPNRTLLADRLDHALARASRNGGEVAVLFLDLDRFKLINDSLGHAVGDGVLVALADRLQRIVRATDTVARFGGDEFVVVCEDAREGLRLADRLAEAVLQPVVVDGEEMFLSVSVGVAVAQGAQSAEAILRDADAAMYRAKERGRARIEYFDETMRTEAAAKLESHSALHRALERREFRVHYQPIVDLRTGQVETVEALVRWAHPERGMVSPGEFIPVAEESGLIVPLGAWVLEEAARHHKGWRGEHPTLGLGVNISARQLRHPDLVPSLRDTLARTGTPPSSLIVELTESVLMEDMDAHRHALTALRDLGVRLAIDDFGTGYSSLTYLRRFPVDTVKIDQTFVQGLASDPADRAIVESVVDLAHALGMRVVAEGVESRTQVDLLRRLGCDQAQGHWFDAAQPADAVGRILSRPRLVPLHRRAAGAE
ncbi:MAG TPA: EAL domain-containing protein [Acidimicrobiales bacterium]|nr:EAL domain-containing protein [Acidimicrobiales bacterium]